MLMLNSTGDSVGVLQKMLIKAGFSVGPDGADGEFGKDTEAAVKAYQTAHRLEVDGIAGPETWASLFAVGPKPPPVNDQFLTAQQAAEIATMAAHSAIASYSWRNRGVAPIGYTEGMAVMFGQCLLHLRHGDSAAKVMSQPIGASGKDALAYYTISATGEENILRKTFMMLFGLGMRESSGNYTEGRDMSASNVTSDTAEAGLFQQSWNSASASAQMPKLLSQYKNGNQPCAVNIFAIGITPKQTVSFGSGDGYDFQQLAKSCPAFAVEMAAVGIRVLYNHWGPIVRQEVEIRAEAEAVEEIHETTEYTDVTEKIRSENVT